MNRKCDVLIVGGGVAGISAAVAAAREGARTILAEKHDFLGGIAVAGLHRYICGLYANGPGLAAETLNDGIPREVCSRLGSLAPGKKVVQIGRVYVLPYSPGDLDAVMRTMIEGEDSLDVFLNSRVVAVEIIQKIFLTAKLRHFNGESLIHPRVVVDCSGDGVLLQQGGLKYEIAPPFQRQLAGYSFLVKGIKHREELLRIKVPYYLNKLVETDDVPVYLRYTTFSFGDAADEGIFTLNIPPAAADDRDQTARSEALMVHRYLSGAIPSLEVSYIDKMAPAVMDREGPRLCGEYTLTADDVLSMRKFPDGAVKNAWPIELWDQERGPSFRHVDTGDYYEIPLRCFKARDVSNLYCAGRCISVSHEALGSTRGSGTCFSIGEQAGREAARYVASIR